MFSGKKISNRDLKLSIVYELSTEAKRPRVVSISNTEVQFGNNCVPFLSF